MQNTRTFGKHQQRRVKAQREHSDRYRFFNLLTSDVLLDKVETLLPDYRKRLYPPAETLSMFLAQAMSADRSCQNSVNQAVISRFSGGLPVGSAHTGGYCRARQRLPVEMIKHLTHSVGEHISQQSSEVWRWQVRSNAGNNPAMWCWEMRFSRPISSSPPSRREVSICSWNSRDQENAPPISGVAKRLGNAII